MNPEILHLVEILLSTLTVPVLGFMLRTLIQHEKAFSAIEERLKGGSELLRISAEQVRSIQAEVDKLKDRELTRLEEQTNPEIHLKKRR